MSPRHVARALLAAWMGVATLCVAEDLTPEQMDAYRFVVRADQARERGSASEALDLYRKALEKYMEMAQRNPRWHPQQVESRIAYCAAQIEQLERGVDEAPPDNSVPAEDAASDDEAVADAPPVAPFQRMRELEAQVAQLNAERKEWGYALTASSNALQRMVQEQEQTLVELQAAQRELAAARKELAAPRKPAAPPPDLIRRVEALQRELDQARARQSAEESACTTLEEELASLRKTVARLEKQLAASEQQRNELEQMQALLHEEKKMLVKQLDDESVRLRAAERAAAERSTGPELARLAEMERQNARLQARIRDLEEELVPVRALRREKADVEKALAAERAEVARLKDQGAIDQLNGMVASLNRRLKESEARKEDLLLRIKELQKEIAFLNRRS